MSNDASKLLEDMRRSKTKWGHRDLVKLYKEHGFVVETRTKRDKVWHPDYPELVTFVPRKKKILIAFVVQAIKMVDYLNQLKGLEE